MGKHTVPIELGGSSHIGHKRRNWLVSLDLQQMAMVMRDLQITAEKTSH